MWTLPDDWTWTALGGVSSVVSKGTTPTTLGYTFTKNGVPFLRAEDVKGSAVDINNVQYHISSGTHEKLSRSQLMSGDLLITIAGSLGRVGYVPPNVKQLNCNQAVAFVRLKPGKLDLKYACFALQQNAIRDALLDVKKVGTIGNLNLQQVRDCKIPLPPLAEQQRIAGILARADRLRQMRRYALQLSEGYLQSVFLQMFGDPVARESWPLVKVEALAAKGKNKIRTGPFGSDLLHSEFNDDPNGVMVFGIDNAVQNRFDWGKSRYITQEKYAKLKRYTVYPDDVLITIMGTCGRCAVVPKNIPIAINTKHLCCITLEKTKCLPTFLHSSFLLDPTVLNQLGESERGAIMAGLNSTIIKGLELRLPPLPLQQHYEEVVQKFERLQAQQREAARQAEHLFATLLHRAFRGEL